jgi:hypothetical protein
MTRLQALDDGIWTVTFPFKVLAFEIDTRTTIVRLPDGALWVHSPGELSDSLAEEVSKLGEVGHIIAPSKIHHLFVMEWKARWPKALIHLAPGLPEKRTDIPCDSVLGDVPRPEWAGVIDQVSVQGFPRTNEVAFFHRTSRTLILTDLLEYARHGRGVVDTLFWKAAGVLGKPGRSILGKMLMKDRVAARRGIDTILEWNFNRVLLAHRDSVDVGGKEVMRRAFADV